MKQIFKTFATGLFTISLTALAEVPADNLDAVGLKEAHKISRGSKDVTVALLSTSLNCRLPALRPSIDRLSRDIDPSFDACAALEGEPSWSLDHGTYSASVIARIAPEVRIKPIRVFGKNGSASQLQLAEAIKLAIDEDVDVIAFGGGGYFANDSANALCDLVDLAARRGISFVVPAGNSAEEITSDKPVIMSSCRNEALFSVAALDDTLQGLAAYSNYSAHYVQLASPGSKVTGLNASGQSYTQVGTTVSYLVGAGVIALRRSVHPHESTYDRREALLSAAHPLPSLVSKVESMGVLSLPAALQ